MPAPRLSARDLAIITSDPVAWAHDTLCSKLTQADIRLYKRGQPNQYRLANWLGAVPDVTCDDNARSYRDKVAKAFLPGFAPAEYVLRRLNHILGDAEFTGARQ